MVIREVGGEVLVVRLLQDFVRDFVLVCAVWISVCFAK